MILAGSHAGAERLARFRAEAEVFARLEHPHIVHIYEVGEHAGAPFFALEFIEGQNLLQRLAAGRWSRPMRPNSWKRWPARSSMPTSAESSIAT